MIVQKKNNTVQPVERQTGESFPMVVKTMFGFEALLAEELRACGATDIELRTRAVACKGTMEVLYRANYTCRTALAVLRPFASFTAHSTDELYDAVYQIAWEKLMDVDCTFMIDSTVSGDIFTHSYYAALKMKDAIADRFRNKFGRRPSIDTENAHYKYNLHIEGDQITLLMNSSGESLHKRGYRQGVGVAPLNEVLAAGMLQLAGWKADRNFMDPMCGSGTLLIEAAMVANNIPAQYYRGDNFAFRRWKEFNRTEWLRIKAEEDSKIGRSDFDFEIWGNDIDRNVLEQAETNLQYTKLHKDVLLYEGSFEEQAPPEGPTLIVTNPPYGERIKINDLNSMYSRLGDTFKRLYGAECEVWLISSDMNAIKHIGLKPSKKIELYNGALECRLLKYELYEGSRKASKQPGSSTAKGKTPKQ